jgi:hypothetical protein
MVMHVTESHLEAFGGYPYDYLWEGDKLFVAKVDEKGCTSLERYKKAELLAWHDRAVALVQAGECDFFGDEPDFKSALYEAETELEGAA